MRGLHTAGVLLTPALAGALSLEDSISRAFITLPLPEATDATPNRDLVFRFDINESQDACGYGNVTINGQKLSEDGNGSLSLDGDRVVDAAWNFTCVTWNDKPQEQLLSLNVQNVNGRAVEDVGFTLRFQQVAPVWISDVEGSASMTRVHSNHQGQPEPDCDDDKELDLDAELAELDFLRWQMFDLAQLLHAKEIRLAEAFGWERHHRPAPRIHECDSLKCVIEAIAHTVKGAASSIYGGGEGPRPHWPNGPHGPHGPGPHPHHPGDKHRDGPHHHFGKPGHGNHTENGTHPYPPPPHGRKPHFPHPPPFCKCAPPPPHHGDHPPPPHHGGPPPPPPPPPPPHGAYPPPPPPPPPPHGDFPPPPPGFGPPPPPHGGPGFWESLFGFVHPHGPPPPMPWERPDWEHPGPDRHSHHGHGHGHEGGPPRMGHEGHHGPSEGGHEEEHSHHEGKQHSDEPERPHEPEGKPDDLNHDDHKPSDDSKGPETKVDEHPPSAHSEKPEDSRPAHPEGHHADMPWEAELRRGHDHKPPPHDGPHDHEEFPGHHAPPPGPPPPGPPPPGPPPPPGHHGHGPPPPPPPPPHGPHGPSFVHIASAIASLVLIVVFGSVLYQRYVRKSIRKPRVRRNSSAPWYKRLCFGPNYSELSEDEEKEAMLRNVGDSDSDSDEADSDVVARDISQFRTAADVVGEMVAVEEARMVAHSRQPSFSVTPPPVQAPVQVQHQHMLPQQQPQQRQMHPYIPAHLMPTNTMPMPMSMPTGQLSPDPATMAAMAAMFPDLAGDLDMDELVGGHHHGGVGEMPVGEELPAYQEADRQSESDESEFASSMVTDGYRPGCSGSSYTPSESGSQGAGDILGDTKN